MDGLTRFTLIPNDDFLSNGIEIGINNIILEKFIKGDKDGIEAVNIQFGMALRAILEETDATEL
jgi:hypothetical protein